MNSFSEGNDHINALDRYADHLEGNIEKLREFVKQYKQLIIDCGWSFKDPFYTARIKQIDGVLKETELPDKRFKY